MHVHEQGNAPSRHACLIYDGHPTAQLPVIVPMLLDGLRTNRRCLYAGDHASVRMIDSALMARGVDTAREARRGALIYSSDRSYLKNGFDPNAMVDAVVQAVDGALDDGFEGLCASADMRWELQSDEHFERLLEYEALVDQVLCHKPLTAICQYHRGSVPAQAVQDALFTHRSVFVGKTLHRDNWFYLSPEVVLSNATGTDRRGEWLSRQILGMLTAERLRDDTMTSLRQSEMNQRTLAWQLAESNVSLERRLLEQTADVDAARRELETLTYSVSHDLSAPLREIDVASRALDETSSAALDDDGRVLVDRVRSGVQRMDQLIDGMLSLSRVSGDRTAHDLVDLSQVAAGVVTGLRAADPGRLIEIAIEPDLVTFGDRRLLGEALGHLFSNAWKFTARSRAARITFGRSDTDGEHVVFYVADNGVGFDATRADRLFGAFQRLHGDRDYPGAGLGLATVQRIVQRHRGRIWADSRPGEGATFYFSLPAR